jgi:hypothetical protein
MFLKIIVNIIISSTPMSPLWYFSSNIQNCYAVPRPCPTLSLYGNSNMQSLA